MSRTYRSVPSPEFARKSAEVDAKFIVSNITALTTEQINALHVGDFVAKEDSTGKHTYIVSYKKEKTGICLTYTDASVVETVSYDYTAGNWVYNSTDITPLGGGGSSDFIEVDISDNPNTTVNDLVTLFEVAPFGSASFWVKLKYYREASTTHVETFIGQLGLSTYGTNRANFSPIVFASTGQYSHYSGTDTDKISDILYLGSDAVLNFVNTKNLDSSKTYILKFFGNNVNWEESTGTYLKLYKHTIVLHYDDADNSYEIYSTIPNQASGLFLIQKIFNSSFDITDVDGIRYISGHANQFYSLDQSGPDITTANILYVHMFNSGEGKYTRTSIATNVAFVSDTVEAV